MRRYGNSFSKVRSTMLKPKTSPLKCFPVFCVRPFTAQFKHRPTFPENPISLRANERTAIFFSIQCKNRHYRNWRKEARSGISTINMQIIFFLKKTTTFSYSTTKVQECKQWCLAQELRYSSRSIDKSEKYSPGLNLWNYENSKQNISSYSNCYRTVLMKSLPVIEYS